MNFQQASEELKKIIAKMNHYSVPEKLKDFATKLDDEALLEIQADGGKTPSKARTATAILNDKATKSRPIFSKAVNRNGFQDFTNGYILAHLSEEHSIEGLKHHEIDDHQYTAYPSFEQIINVHTLGVKTTANVNILESKIAKKEKRLIKFDYWNDSKGFDPELVIQALTLLDYKSGETVQIELSSSSGIIKNHDSLVIIMSKISKD